MYNELKDISNSNEWKRVEKIEAGWSTDKKYKVVCFDERKYLVRLSPIEYHEMKLKEFAILTSINNKNISRPIDCGICNGGEDTYLIFNWIDGVEADQEISKLSFLEQYNLGVQSGRLLREIHSLKVVKTDDSWKDRYSKKIDRNINNYHSCDYRVEGFSEIIDYITENKHLLDGRKLTAQHGDYHIGNMIITPSNEIAVIDFNRFDIGDPWEEFNRITWSSSVSKYFATGQINGYFNNDVPDEFFKLLALYIGSNQLASIPWAVDFGADEVSTMINEANKVIRDYDFYKTYIPCWYIGNYDEVMKLISK
jgi:aminoglycoside phosphotransferase (APT) family kinase protein